MRSSHTRFHPTHFCIRCEQPMTWQGLQRIEVKGKHRAVNIYHCDLCDKLSALTLPVVQEHTTRRNLSVHPRTQ
jgi:hypothetical protein